MLFLYVMLSKINKSWAPFLRKLQMNLEDKHVSKNIIFNFKS